MTNTIKPSLDELLRFGAWNGAEFKAAKSVSKFQPCLPPDLEHGLLARETLNVEDANATLAQLKRREQQEVGKQ